MKQVSKHLAALSIGVLTGIRGGTSCCSESINTNLSPISPAPLSQGKSRIIFLGTGNSTGNPRMSCLTDPKKPNCRVSRLAMDGSPDCNRNYRCSPSMLIQYNNSDAGVKNILVDCGKHFREAMLRWFPRYQVDWVQGVVITHDHADAIMGMDELRQVQKCKGVWEDGKQKWFRSPLPLFSNYRHISRLKNCFPYLTDRPRSPPHTLEEDCDSRVKNVTPVNRFVAQLSWHSVADFENFNVCGLDILSLPVWHGEDYICMGLAFGTVKKVLYLSDVSMVPSSTMKRISAMGSIDILVVDTLFTKRHPTHFCLSQALDLVRTIRPKRTLLVGLSDEFEHFETNAKLKRLLVEEDLDVQLAYDGLSVDLVL